MRYFTPLYHLKFFSTFSLSSIIFRFYSSFICFTPMFCTNRSKSQVPISIFLFTIILFFTTVRLTQHFYHQHYCSSNRYRMLSSIHPYFAPQKTLLPPLKSTDLLEKQMLLLILLCLPALMPRH